MMQNNHVFPLTAYTCARAYYTKPHLMPYNCVYILAQIYITRYLCTLTYIKY